jgi:phosphoglycerate kinase
MKSLEDAPISQGTKVLVRCDLDVPIEHGIIREKYRLDNLLPTLNYLKQKKAQIIVMGHIGKPKGKHDDKLSTAQLQPYFDKQLGTGSVVLLENLRFDPREESNDLKFAQGLAKLAKVYINESFATCHRKHASIVGVPQFIPSFAGFRLIREVEVLSKAIRNPDKPLVAIIGGAKIESKLPVINKFLDIADAVLAGGKIGMEWQGAVPEKLHLPADYAKGNKDIGLKTTSGYIKIIETAKTIVWAGPMGLYEEPPYNKGTGLIAKAITDSSAYSIIGGGDTIAAVNSFDLLDNFNFASTGGGAMLEFLSKGTLPGLEVLNYA